MIEPLRLVGPDDPVLRVPAIPATVATWELARELGVAMRAVVTEWGGCGLAAPQVGYGLRVLVVLTPTLDLTLINPVVEGMGIMAEAQEEGCLSLPGTLVNVIRRRSADVTGLLLDGTTYRQQHWNPRDARVLMHEFDHLEGRLITDYFIGTGEQAAQEQEIRRAQYYNREKP